MVMKIPEPVHQSRIIIGAEIVPVLKDESAFNGVAYLFFRRQHGIRKNIFIDPGIDTVDRIVAADGMQEKDPIRLQSVPDNPHEAGIVFVAHMFKHPDGKNPVEFVLELPIVLQSYFDRQTFTPLLGKAGLFL